MYKTELKLWKEQFSKNKSTVFLNGIYSMEHKLDILKCFLHFFEGG